MSNLTNIISKTLTAACVLLALISMNCSVAAQSGPDKEAIADSNSQIYDFSRDITPDYQPTTDEEKELWEVADKWEAEFVENSSKIIDDPELNAYVKSVLCKTIGNDRCAPIRLYLVRTTQFNALMAPNGMMQVWSGLLIRMENEAQLASILGHEYAHYARRHSLQALQLAKNLEWTSVVPYVGILASVGTVGSIFAFSRDMETEADRLSLNYIHAAGYDPQSPSLVWRQLLDEFEVTREKQDFSILESFFSTHPNSENRLQTLSDQADSKGVSDEYVTNRAQYRVALGKWWPKFINDQIIAKDFKTGEYLVDRLAKNGWDSELYFAKAELLRKRGEKGDFKLAIEHYQKSIDAGSEKAENWRGIGLSLMRDSKREEGKAALIEYLRRLPNAVDRKMIHLLTGSKEVDVSSPLQASQQMDAGN